MALSKAASAFVLHQCNDHGRSTKEVARRWGNTYPEDAFTAGDADELLGIKPAKKARKKKK